MRILSAATAASLMFVSTTLAESPSQTSRAELIEWVFGPCTNVAAALQVGLVEQEYLDAGLRRTHLAQVLLDEKQAALEKFVAKAKADVAWEDRRKAYPILLRMCLETALAEQ